MKSFVCGVVVVLAGAVASTALAQTAPQGTDVPLMGSEAAPGDVANTTPGTTPEPGAGFGGTDGIFRILVIGDSLAGGFGAGMTRMAENDPRIEVVNRFNEASGLARPEIYDWVTSVPKIVVAKEYDAAVVHLGVNDRQAIRSSSGRLEFKSPEWIDAYKSQAKSLAGKLTDAGLHVYWVVIPPMGEEEFDADMKFISGLQREAVQEKGVQIVDLSRHFLGADGRYSERGLDETGVERKLRARDGITFMKLGNNRFGQLLVEAVKSTEIQSSGQTAGSLLQADSAAAPKPEASSGVQIEAPVALPTFGQQGLNGEEIAFNASGLNPAVKQSPATASKPVQTAEVGTTAKTIKAAVGSAAELLFTTGEGVAPPPGRFDDFSMPQQP